MRRLLGHGGPARARRLRRHRVDRDQLLPGAGRGARRPGGRHLRGARARPRRCTRSSTRWRSAAARSAATARPGSSARMAAEFYRAGRAATNGTGPDTQDDVPRRQRLRPARDQRQPVPLHRLPADQGRRVRARLPRRRRRARRPPYDARPGRAADPARRRRGARSSGRRRWPRPSRLLADHPDAVVVAGSTDWGVEVNLKGRRADRGAGGRPARGAARLVRSPTTRSGSAPR